MLPTPRADNPGRTGDKGTGGPTLNEALLRCSTCGCLESFHDGDGFCAGPCGGNDYDCGGRGRLLDLPLTDEITRESPIYAATLRKQRRVDATFNTHNPAFDTFLDVLIPTRRQPILISDRICPECFANKHENCDGTSWDDESDGLGVCPCSDSGHAPA